jgi:hypothetical protein
MSEWDTYLYIYSYIYIYIYMHTYIHAYTYIHTHMHTYIYIYTYTHDFNRIQVLLSESKDQMDSLRNTNDLLHGQVQSLGVQVNR